MNTVQPVPSEPVALGEYRHTQLTQGESIVVAMSGGVDSCASALMLHEQGYSVIGISMQVWDYRRNGGNASRATCCAPSDFDDARQVADACGFPYYVFDFEDSFYQAVIDPFVKSYLAGKTPNPCMDCNRKVKFHQLRQRANALGSKYVATGHFAQVHEKPDGLLGLYTAADGNKDQSYFLYAMTQHDLRHTLFPVGAMTKPVVREYLRARGHRVSEKAESQDICFVGSSVGEFIEREAGKQAGGNIVDRQGTVLGTHSGVHQFTVGQRRGVGVSSAHPLYVLQIDPNQRHVVVGAKDELQRESFVIDNLTWVSGVAPQEPIVANVKIRYRHAGVRCRIEPLENNAARLTFLDEWSAVSPGQAAVIYGEKLGGCEVDGMVEVLGGGIIVKDADVH